MPTKSLEHASPNRPTNLVVEVQRSARVIDGGVLPGLDV